MNTTDLVQLLAKRLKISQVQARRLLQLKFGLIRQHMSEGKSVVLRGFGTFTQKESKARQMKIPSTGEHRLIPARKNAAFRPAQKLKDDTKMWRP